MLKIVTCLAAMLVMVGAAEAQRQLPMPADAKFVVQLDLARFRATELGDKLVKFAKDMAEHEIGDEGPDVLGKVEEALGFDPLEEIQSITVIGSEFKDLEENFRAMVQLKSTTGNLEGLLLSLPGYDSSEHGDYTIHAVDDDDDLHAFGAIHGSASGTKRVVISTEKTEVVEMLDSLDSDGDRRASSEVTRQLPKGSFAHLQLLAFPLEELDEGPPANIAKMIEELSVDVAENEGRFTVKLSLTTAKEKKAEQLEQLIKGATALIGLLEGEIEDELGDEQAAAVLQAFSEISVERNGTAVNVTASLPGEIILEFLKEEADLPL